MNSMLQTGLLLGMLIQQQEVIQLQQELLESQKEIIKLKDELTEKLPKEPEKNMRWHISSGMTSEDVMNSDDKRIIEAYKNWIVEFAKKYLKPYVHRDVYSEATSPMLRGIPTRLARMDTDEFFSALPSIKNVVEFPETKEKPSKNDIAETEEKDVKQLPLLQ